MALEDPGGPTIPVYDEAVGDCEMVCLLSLRDLLATTLLLRLFSPPSRQGIVLSWDNVIGYIASHADPDKQLAALLPAGLRFFYIEKFCVRSKFGVGDIKLRARNLLPDKVCLSAAQSGKSLAHSLL